MHKKFLFLLLIAYASLLITKAEGSYDYRTYMGVTGTHVSIAGSFDGASFFVIEDDVIMVPKLSSAYGYGVVAGIRWPKLSWEIAYKRSSHICTLPEGPNLVANFNVIEFFDFKAYLSSSKINLFLDFEFSGSWMRIENAAYSQSMPDKKRTGSYGSIIVGMGVGTEIKLASKLHFECAIMPAYYIGTDVKGIENKHYEIKKFGNFKFDLSTSLIYYFDVKR